MEPEFHYETVSQAINELKKRGFTMDFNIRENCIVCAEGTFQADEFDIVDVYRYEGDTDPADEAVVYALQSKSGLRGVLVSGYGASTDSMTADVLEKLHSRH
jgi:hypothetical protein